MNKSFSKSQFQTCIRSSPVGTLYRILIDYLLSPAVLRIRRHVADSLQSISKHGKYEEHKRLGRCRSFFRALGNSPRADVVRRSKHQPRHVVLGGPSIQASLSRPRESGPWWSTSCLRWPIRTRARCTQPSEWMASGLLVAY